MGRRKDIELKNNKYGFLAVIAVELALTAAFLAAAVYSYSAPGVKYRSASLVCLAAMAYITARSVAAYRRLRRREKQDGGAGK